MHFFLFTQRQRDVPIINQSHVVLPKCYNFSFKTQLSIIYSESTYLITPGQPLELCFYGNSIIFLLFSHKQQQKLIICC